MNDRGARLTSVDLMKSFLLSRANRDVEKPNELWRDMIREVTRQRGDADAPKEFLKAYLIGRHASLADDPTTSDRSTTRHISGRAATPRKSVSPRKARPTTGSSAN
jgi:hypothetical protein